MAIYIKGMEMPYSCSDCILFRECKVISRWLTKDMVHRLKEERHPNCPLTEVKPHGRLIDADALKETIAENVYPVADHFNSRDYGMFWTGGIEKAIDEQPTVIERSEDEDDLKETVLRSSV